MFEVESDVPMPSKGQTEWKTELTATLSQMKAGDSISLGDMSTGQVNGARRLAKSLGYDVVTRHDKASDTHRMWLVEEKT